jgi:glycosyltransferase involved in cell wall biosynthesis
MKILHLTTFLQGGAGRVITDLALAQHAAGHDVLVVTSKTGAVGYGNYETYLDELGRAGIGTRLVDSMFERQHAANLAVVRMLDDEYRDGGEPDVIHAHAAVPSLVALIFVGARRAGARIVQTMHGWGIVKTGDQIATDVALLNLVDGVVVPSRQAADTLVSLGVSPSRITLVPYGVGPSSAPGDDRDAALVDQMVDRRSGGALVVACVGSFGPRKNQPLLVEAMARTTAPVFAVFVGDGDDRDLRAAIDQTGTADRVRVHGFSAAARRIAAAADGQDSSLPRDIRTRSQRCSPTWRLCHWPRDAPCSGGRVRRISVDSPCR